MGLLPGSVEKQVRDALAKLTSPVTLVIFTRRDQAERPCESCRELHDLAGELVALSGGRVAAEFFDIDDHAERAAAYRIDKAPAIVVLGERRRDFGIRYFGLPAGYEFGTLLEDIRLASVGRSDLSRPTLGALARLDTPMHIQVFVTSSCPYCPRAVLLAHRIAMASDLVTADAVDAAEFPELAYHYHVHGVPRTVVNEDVHIEGAVPESMLIRGLFTESTAG